LNSFELNKIAGAGLGTLLFVMWLNVISGAIFAHGKLGKPGYPLPAEQVAAASGGAATPSVAPIGQRLAAADVQKGQADTKPCQACHNFEKGTGAKIGPPLYGIVDRVKASVAGFNYSEAIQSRGGEWTYGDLDQFLANPKAYAQGTKMAFAGETDPAKRADIIDYLHTLSDNPEPLPVNNPADSAHGTRMEPPASQLQEPAAAVSAGPLPARGSPGAEHGASTEPTSPQPKQKAVETKDARQPKLASRIRK
jgi:cytochrome c